MTYLKKTAAAVAVLALSSSVYAGTMGVACTATPVTVPCEFNGWDFGGKALYLQAVYNNDYGYNNVFNNNGNYYYSRNNDRWGWGFMIEGSYHFGTGNDLNVNWYHFDHKHHVDREVFFDQRFLSTNWRITEKPRWDAVNVEFGQHVDFGEFKDIRFHGGAQFARISHQNFYWINTLLNPNSWASFNERFNGFGPRVGADMKYNFGNGFAMYANGATAILVGNSTFTNAANLFIETTPVTFPRVHGSRRAIVPELEAKLGVTYDYAMAQGVLTLDVGYMWLNYFNAVHNVNGFAPSVVNVHSDFGLHGVQFGAKYVGTV